MSKLILGISGVVMFFLLSHLAMLTYYKKYLYWWHYYCNLGYTIPENRTSMLLYSAGITYFAIMMSLVWVNIGTYLTLNVGLIRLIGIIGCISFILIIVFPYEKSKQIHFISLFFAFSCLTVVLVIANMEIHHLLLTIYFWCFLAYLFVVILTTIMYRNGIKKAHKYQAPIQKTFVILLDITIIVFCITLASL
jgi:hypothetical protein